MTSPLSPAAKAALDTFTRAACGSTYQVHKGIAAVLRAAAGSVRPVHPSNLARLQGRDRTLWLMGNESAARTIEAQLRIIAAELEGNV